MNRIHSPMQEINWISKLADLKEQHYRNTLLVTALMELLIEKGLLTTQELEQKLLETDRLIAPDLTYPTL